MPVDADRRIAEGVRRTGRPGQKTVRPGFPAVVRRGESRELNAIDDETRPRRVRDEMNARRVVVAQDDVLARRGSRNLALRCMDERSETGEYLHVVARGRIRLDI